MAGSSEVHRIREAWSPTPVLGYRVWFVLAGAFHGAWERWEHPSLRARCLTTSTDDGVPHTDGRCGPHPCGIYAAKNVRRLLEPVNLAAHIIAGLTAIEHSQRMVR